MRAMALILQRAYTVQCITPDVSHHPIVQHACGAFAIICSTFCASSFVYVQVSFVLFATTIALIKLEYVWLEY